MDLAAERHRFRELLQQREVAMLLTFGGGEVHAGRSMLPLWLPEDPNIYFLTHRESRKSGAGQRTTARRRSPSSTPGAIWSCSVWLMRLRSPPYSPPLASELSGLVSRGSDDREATVRRIVINKVTYWEPPRNRVRRLFQTVTAVVTRQPVETPMRTIDRW